MGQALGVRGQAPLYRSCAARVSTLVQANTGRTRKLTAPAFHAQDVPLQLLGTSRISSPSKSCSAHHALAMLVADGFTNVEIARLLPAKGHRFAKTNCRPLTSSMNDHLRSNERLTRAAPFGIISARALWGASCPRQGG